MLTTIDAVIEHMGGTFKAAERLGVQPSAVSNWRFRKRLPSDRYIQIRAAVGEAEIAPDLFGFAADTEAAE